MGRAKCDLGLLACDEPQPYQMDSDSLLSLARHLVVQF